MADTAVAKRAAKASITYIGADGAASNFPLAGTTVIRTAFANGVNKDFTVGAINADVAACALQQGLVTRIQRSYNAVKTVDEAIEAYDETVADLLAGVWIESKSGEPKVTMLSRAIVLTLEGGGETVSDERRQGIIEKLKNAEYRDKASANPHVQMHLQALRLDAQKQRAKEAKEAAKTVDANLSDF